MAFGDYWKAVSSEDYEKIQERLRNYGSENDEADSAAIDWAYKLFGEKYGAEIRLVERFQYDLSIDPETEEQFYVDEEGNKVFGDWTTSDVSGYRYLDSDFSETTIEYIEIEQEKIIQQANDLAQNHWYYASNLQPERSNMTFDEYQQQLAEAGYEHFDYPGEWEDEDDEDNNG